MNKKLKVFANYAYAKAILKDEAGDMKFNNVPNQKINTGISYTLPLEKTPITLSLINKNVSGYFVSESAYGTRNSGYRLFL